MLLALEEALDRSLPLTFVGLLTLELGPPRVIFELFCTMAALLVRGC